MSGVTPSIEITVSPAGEVSVQTKGIAGPGCREASRFIEQALGEKAAEQLTADFYQSHIASEQLRQRG